MHGLRVLAGSACAYILCFMVLASPAHGSDARIAIDKGRQFLVSRQNKDGSWGSARHTKATNLLMPVPGGHQALRCAVTALCVRALLKVGPGDAEEALNKATAYLIATLPTIKRCSPGVLYNIWTHAYGIQALLELEQAGRLSTTQKKAAHAAITIQLKRLETFSTAQGGWAYYNFDIKTARPNSQPVSFTSAVILAAIKDARDAGFSFSAALEKKALKAVLSQRKPDSSYLYSHNFRYYPQSRVNQPAGSLGRTQACNYGLSRWSVEAITAAEHKTQLKRFIRRNGWLDIGRKRPIPHEAWFSVAGYYFYFGHYYAALNTGYLVESDRKPVYDALTKIMVMHQELDGSWWDFPMYNYHKFYGTAFALITLAECTKTKEN